MSLSYCKGLGGVLEIATNKWYPIPCTSKVEELRQKQKRLCCFHAKTTHSITL